MWLPSSFACKRKHNLDPENVIEVKKKTKSSKKSELREQKPKVGSSCTVKNYRKPSNIGETSNIRKRIQKYSPNKTKEALKRSSPLLDPGKCFAFLSRRFYLILINS